MTAAGPDRGAGALTTRIKKGRGQRMGTEEPDPAGDNKGDKYRMTLGLDSQ